MRSSTFTTIGGVIAILGSVIHLTLTSFARADVWARIVGEGWWSTITLRPDAETITMAEAFWLTPGSFAVPLLLLGLVALSVAKNDLALPRAVGWVLIVWGAFCATLIPISGAWAFIAVGILFLRGTAAQRRERARARSGAPELRTSAPVTPPADRHAP